MIECIPWLQDLFVEPADITEGAVLVGHKFGCTAEGIQRLFGIETPDYGLIFDDSWSPTGCSIGIN